VVHYYLKKLSVADSNIDGRTKTTIVVSNYGQKLWFNFQIDSDRLYRQSETEQTLLDHTAWIQRLL
jgi:hypothetical protein